MTIENKCEKHCISCASWVRLSNCDGGLGICDSIKSDHNQHLLGYWHPACSVCLSPCEGKAGAANAEPAT